jgi:hypothetical protein
MIPWHSFDGGRGSFCEAGSSTRLVGQFRCFFSGGGLAVLCLPLVPATTAKHLNQQDEWE